MSLFTTKESLQKQLIEVQAEVFKLQGLLEVEKERTKFFENRGDRYAHLRDHIEKVTNENNILSKQLLETTIKTLNEKVICCNCRDKK